MILIKGISLFFSISFSYASEILGQKLRTIFGPLSFTFYSIGGILVNILSAYENNYKIYIIILMILSLISLFLNFLFIESPYYLYKQNDIVNLHKCLLNISQRNNPREKYTKLRNIIESRLRFRKTLKNQKDDYYLIDLENSEQNFDITETSDLNLLKE